MVQLEVTQGAPQANCTRMLAAIARAKDDGVRLLLFPAAAIGGERLGARGESASFRRECRECVERIVAASHGITLLFGNLCATATGTCTEESSGNALLCAEDGVMLPPQQHTAVLATAESAAFTLFKTRHAGVIALASTTTAAASHTAPEGLLPQAALEAARQAEIVVVAHNSRYCRNESRAEQLARRGKFARCLQRPLLWLSAVGVSDQGHVISLMEGGASAHDASGRLWMEAPRFQEAALTLDTTVESQRTALTSQGTAPVPLSGCATTVEALLYSMATLMRRLQIERVVIGVSGGLDSAVTAALYRRLLTPENLLLVAMPGPFTSATTLRLGRALARNLAARWIELPIDASVALTREQFATLPTQEGERALLLNDAMVENVQARDRGSRLLMAAAAAFGGVVSCNANKSEIAIGYGTMYGDILGWLAPLGDLWKGEVYAVARYLNESIYGREVIPGEIFTIKPSAELSAAQAVEKGLGDPLIYPYHDRLFSAWVERRPRVTIEETLEWYIAGSLEEQLGYEGSVNAIFGSDAAFVADLERWWNMHQGLAIAKRLQAPPLLALGKYSFEAAEGAEPQLGPWYSARYQQLKQRIK